MSLPKVSSLDPVDEFLLRLEACPLAVLAYVLYCDISDES
jgi:hypothetical protein